MAEVGFDLDGIIRATEKSVVPVWNDLLRKHSLTDKQYQPADLVTFDFLYSETLRLSGSKELASEAVGLWNREDVVGNAPPYWQAVLVLNLLRYLGGHPVIVTTSPANVREVTFETVSRYLPWIANEKRLRVRTSSDTRNGNLFKTDEIEKMGLVAFTDDNADTIRFIKARVDQRGLKTKLIFKNHYWNVGDKDTMLAPYRVSSWTQILLRNLTAMKG